VTLLTAFEVAARAFEPPPPPRWATPGALARELDPQTVQTPALDIIDAALVDVAEGRCDRLMICLPPQEGKTTRVTQITPLWMLIRNPDMPIAIVSYAEDLAEDFGRAIRNMIVENSGDEDTLDLGLRIAPDNGAARRWRIDGHKGGVRSVGITGGLTGRPAHALFIDDPIANQQQADSAAHRKMVWDWFQTVGSTRLAPGAPVVLVQTRWHEDDLAGKLLKAEDGHRWRVISIPAQADHDPAKGQADRLGRRPGEWLESARGRTAEQWEQIKVQVGERGFQALYQGRPAKPGGVILKRAWWSFYDTPRAVTRTDGTMWVPGPGRLVTSWDMAFKGTDTSDFVCGQVWEVDGVNAYLLDQVHGRMSFVQTLAAFVALARKWPQANAHYIEDKANGPAVMSMLRGQVPGLLPVEPRGSKSARAHAVAPLVQSRNVHLPDPLIAPWVSGLLAETDAFPHGANDDQVDALTQAVSELLLDMAPTSDSTTWYSLTRRAV